jgi:hypothetical protein
LGGQRVRGAQKGPLPNFSRRQFPKGPTIQTTEPHRSVSSSGNLTWIKSPAGNQSAPDLSSELIHNLPTREDKPKPIEMTRPKSRRSRHHCADHHCGLIWRPVDADCAPIRVIPFLQDPRLVVRRLDFPLSTGFFEMIFHTDRIRGLGNVGSNSWVSRRDLRSRRVFDSK